MICLVNSIKLTSKADDVNDASHFISSIVIWLTCYITGCIAAHQCLHWVEQSGG